MNRSATDAVLHPCRSQERFGERPLGHPIHLEAKVKGDKRMSEKRGVAEDAYATARQGPRERANARLPKSQSPAVEPHTHRQSVYGRCCQERPVHVSRGVLAAWQAIESDAMQGDAWGAYVALDTCRTTGTRDRLRGASPRVTEPS